MPLSRLLLPLCGLLLALAVTAATAAAPVYETGELSVTAYSDGSSTTQVSQAAYCTSKGGSLVPIVTEAVYTLVMQAMDEASVVSSFSYMGGSSTLSSWECTTSAPSLKCIWYWDQGRYEGVENVLPFYRGNRNAANLTDAGMMISTVNNHWHVVSDTESCPCEKMERYGAVLRDDNGLPYWSDTSSTTYSYASASTVSRSNYHLCGVDTAVKVTTTAAPANSVASRPLVVGLPVAAALVVMAVVAWL